ncbi:MAG: NUDIX domain-containing protein [Anaerolineales bacterium]
MLLLRGVDHLKPHAFWLVPGGGREPGETEHECVRREMLEETLLDVRVEKLLLEEDAPPGGIYQTLKTFLCTPVAGTAGPGTEPEIEDLEYGYTIEEARWFDLRDETAWNEDILSDDITYPLLQRVRAALGYGPG